jgi:hypothetical protein
MLKVRPLVITIRLSMHIREDGVMRVGDMKNIDIIIRK